MKSKLLSKIKIKQGTISVIFGCHSVFHSFLVLIAWKKLYDKWPKSWQIICIFLHDIGHIGYDYLDDFEQKKRHWKLGAKISGFLFGQKGYNFTAGHCGYSGHPFSELYKADKYSWYIAPEWWLFTNIIFEPKIAMEYTKTEAVKRFKAQVRKSIESGEFNSTHQMYLDRCKE